MQSTPKAMKYSQTLLVERFEHPFRREPEETDSGLLFADSEQGIAEKEIKDFDLKTSRKGVTPCKVQYMLLKIPILAKSHLWNLIQLADWLACVIDRHYRKR